MPRGCPGGDGHRWNWLMHNRQRQTVVELVTVPLPAAVTERNCIRVCAFALNSLHISSTMQLKPRREPALFAGYGACLYKPTRVQWSLNGGLNCQSSRPRSFWSAPRIATSGRVQQRKSAIHQPRPQSLRYPCPAEGNGGSGDEIGDSRTSRHSAHALSQVWQIWLVLVSIYCVYKSIQNRNVVGLGQRSRFLVLTKRSAASGDENEGVFAAISRSGVASNISSTRSHNRLWRLVPLTY